jgi:hypothetical protein
MILVHQACNAPWTSHARLEGTGTILSPNSGIHSLHVVRLAAPRAAAERSLPASAWDDERSTRIRRRCGRTRPIRGARETSKGEKALDPTERHRSPSDTDARANGLGRLRKELRTPSGTWNRDESNSVNWLVASRGRNLS